jgi:hypothetical protein
MNEERSLPEFSCARALSLLAPHVDGDLAGEEASWLEGHLAQCAGCAAELAKFEQLDGELTAWGRGFGHDFGHGVGWGAPEPPDTRERLAAAMSTPAPRGILRRWLPMAAAALAAGVALLAIVPRRPLTDAEGPFIAIPYLAPANPHESSEVVHIQIRVATLIEAGYRVRADPEAVVPADVLVGEDGRAHAVRVASDLGLMGVGD